MSTQHTPGPWAVHRYFPDHVVPFDHRDRHLGGASDERIDRDTYALVVAKADHNAYSKFAHEISVEAACANARLIAAAPEMLAALRAVQPFVVGEGERPKSAYDALKAAIAKAEGKP